MVGAVALLLSAFQLAPLLLDGSNINHSRWEPVWKWDSFGAGQVLKWLFTGELLDHGRLPVLTLLALGGAALFVWNWWKGRPVARLTLSYFGRGVVDAAVFRPAVLGTAAAMLGVSADMQLHRVIGGAQIFLVLLAAIALGALWRELSRRWHVCRRGGGHASAALPHGAGTRAQSGKRCRMGQEEPGGLCGRTAIAGRHHRCGQGARRARLFGAGGRSGAASSRSATCRSTPSSARRTYRR